MQDISSLFAGKTPEEQQQAWDTLMELGILDEEDSDLQAQQAQVQALQSRGAQNYGPGAAGYIGAGADILGALLARKKSDELHRERQDLLQRKKAGRTRFGQMWAAPAPAYDPADGVADVDRPRDFGLEPAGPYMEDGSFFRKPR